MKLIMWDVYEISAEEPLTGVKLRGRLRVFALDHKRNLLVENAEDKENRVRFAIPTGEEVESIGKYIQEIAPTAKVHKVLAGTVNPVLSKVKVNHYERYK